MQKVLVVDDEVAIADLVTLYLKNEGFVVTTVYKGQEALDYIEQDSFDLAILDIMLPDVDGLKICQEIRKNHFFPVIMLTAKETEIDKITGLTLGAEDYITKPFKPLELIARVKAQLRRFKHYNLVKKQDQHIMAVRGLLLDLNKHECWIDELQLSLTPTEFSILQILCENLGNVVSFCLCRSGRKNIILTPTRR